MKKNKYIAPSVVVADMECATIIASSTGLYENGNDVKGNLGNGVEENGDAGLARIASRQYFDAWGGDEEDCEY